MPIAFDDESEICVQFTITGTATDSAGAQSTVTGTLTVVSPPVMVAPVFSPAMPTNGYLAGTAVRVTFAATDPQGLPLTYTAAASDGHALTPVAGTPGAFTFVA